MGSEECEKKKYACPDCKDQRFVPQRIIVSEDGTEYELYEPCHCTRRQEEEKPGLSHAEVQRRQQKMYEAQRKRQKRMKYEVGD